MKFGDLSSLQKKMYVHLRLAYNQAQDWFVTFFYKNRMLKHGSVTLLPYGTGPDTLFADYKQVIHVSSVYVEKSKRKRWEWQKLKRRPDFQNHKKVQGREKKNLSVIEWMW